MVCKIKKNQQAILILTQPETWNLKLFKLFGVL